MNKKSLLFLTAFFLFSYFSFSSEIKIAPISVFDGSGNKVTPPFNPSKAIQSELEKHWFEGVISFSLLNEEMYGIPVTIIDANKICVNEKVDYLIYGFIKKNEKNWFAEIKLYDSNEKKINQDFFASDNIEHYERLINNLCQNILFEIEEITGLNKDEIKKEQTREMELNIPAALFYWTPIDSKWGNKILGIAGLSTGVEFYPPQPIIIFKEKLFEFSIRTNLSWNIGINKKKTYPLILNTIAVSLPVLLHMHFDKRNSLYFGFGLAYEAELMSIRPKYEDKQFLYQNIISFETIAGYEFNLNEKINLFAELIFDFHMLGDGFVSVKPCLGASFNIFKERR